MNNKEIFNKKIAELFLIIRNIEDLGKYKFTVDYNGLIDSLEVNIYKSGFGLPYQQEPISTLNISLTEDRDIFLKELNNFIIYLKLNYFKND